MSGLLSCERVFGFKIGDHRFIIAVSKPIKVIGALHTMQVGDLGKNLGFGWMIHSAEVLDNTRKSNRKLNFVILMVIDALYLAKKRSQVLRAGQGTILAQTIKNTHGTSAQTLEISPKALLKLAVPSTVFTVLTHAYRSVDQFWIKDVSVEAQAAIGANVFVLILFAGFFEMVGAGASPWIARASGAGNLEERKKAFGAGLFGALVIFVFVAIVGGFGANKIVALIGLTDETARQAEIYLRTISLTSLPLALTPLIDLSFTAMGQAKLPMKLHALSLGLNLIFTPLFIYTLDLGIMGAGLASNLSRGIATFIGLISLIRMIGLTRSHIRGGQALRRVLRIGIPVGMGTIIYALSYWVMLMTSISPLGPHINAALGIGFSALEGFTWPCFHGVSLAVASFIGRSLGAKRPSDAIASMKLGLPIVGIMGVIASLLFGFGGEFLTGLFASDVKVHEAAIRYTFVLAFSQIFVAWESLFEGVLNGAGATKLVFWVNFPNNVLRVFLAWYCAFPLGYGAEGVWWAITLTTISKALLKGWFSLRGRWVNVKI